jgi:adenylate kinase family enzyme
MILINLYGAPGAGKSTGAAYIFSQLKMMGVNAELVTEFAKDKTWENNQTALNNQAYVFGKQYYRISRCEKQVDVIVTDSPLMLSLIYNQDNNLGEDFNNVVRNVANSYKSKNYYITRTKEYNPAGRNQTAEESDELGNSIYQMLTDENISFTSLNGDLFSYDIIVNQILKELKGEKI